ncbi:MAG: T9SS type A sorting domain-containing protein [Ignavibacteriae bacterium]|nr:T9SS type A sorting domain-containing protein [Ignavibacteriota bacterium]
MRYSNDNFSSSTVLLMSGSGSNYTATIPAGTNTAGANVKYYVFTSGSGATITHANADLYTINLNNNGGGNYSYTVATSWTSAGSGDWNTSGTWSSNEVPASNQSVTIDHAVTVNNAVTNAASTVSINPSKTLTFGGSGSLSATTLTNNGTVDMSSGGTLSIASGGTLSNNSTFTAGTGKVTFVAGATISGSSAITFNNVDVGGSVSMSSHTVNGTLTILNNTGSFVSSSPTYGAASTLKYTHSGDYSQITEWPSSNGPANVELAATSGGVTMQFSRSISGTLTLTSGKLTLGTNTLTMISGSSISGASSSTYIVTNSTGVLTINNVGATNTLFPIGTSSSYNPVTINNAGTADNFSARVSGSFDVAPNDPNSVLTRQWTITEANAGGSNATLTFQYNGTDPKGVLFTYGGPSKYIGRYTGTQWSATLATLGGSDPYTVTASGFTAFSPFAISEESSALPIQLSSFTGTLVNNRVRLDWTTISEVNNYGFYVEKRMSGSVDWWSIDGSFVAGHGTTSTPQHYSFTDNTLFSAATEYRLKQVDLDGTVHYTDPILVDRPTSVRESAPVQFALSQNYPNPFNPSTEIKFSVPATDRAKLVVFTALGQQVATLFDDVAEAGYYYKVRLDGSNLASGIYYYRLVSGKQSDLRKLVMVK